MRREVPGPVEGGVGFDIAGRTNFSKRASRIDRLSNPLKVNSGEGVPLARKSHRTKARLGGYSERRVCSVVSMPAGGASRREECWNHFALPAQRRSGLGGLWDDAARTTRCGGACQAGEPRALAAAARRRAACPQTSAAGQADAIPTLIRRTLNCTKAPILSNLRRMEPQVALAKCV